jgi:phosphonate degradation associated HDIG domain protein
MGDLEEASTPTGAVDAIFELFESYGRRRYDEVVTQEQHAVQAALLAEHADGRETVIVAALLHDVGHLLLARRGTRSDISAEDRHHEAVGAAVLARWFPPEVTAPIALHVAAKRYLCTVEPGYHDGLSPASRASLVRQGGLFSTDEVERFRRLPASAVAVALRRWDDRAKDPALTGPPVDTFRSLLLATAGSGLR